jgi:DNA-binding Lrp family transcriptional regulator
LIGDGRQTVEEIAIKIGKNRKTIKNNYENMEKLGIITGATTHINYKLFGNKAVAHILIIVDPQQADQLIEYLIKKPEVYKAYCRGIKGNIDVIAILTKLEQLNTIKDLIKRNATVLEMKTVIWTDVKEMNQNLAITDSIRKSLLEAANNASETEIQKKAPYFVIDQIDQKIADKLAEDGRISMEALGREIGISTNLARKKYEKMKDNGILKITIQINLKKIGYNVMCIFFTIISGEKSLSIIQQISKIPDKYIQWFRISTNYFSFKNKSQRSKEYEKSIWNFGVLANNSRSGLLRDNTYRRSKDLIVPTNKLQL